MPISLKKKLKVQLEKDPSKSISEIKKESKKCLEKRDYEGYYELSDLLFSYYRKSSKFKEALELLLNQQEIINQAGSDKWIASLYNGYGDIYWRLGDYKLAMDNYQKCVDLTKGTELKKEYAYALGGIATVYYFLNDINSSLKYDEQCLEIRKDINDITGLIASYGNIGEAFIAIKDYDQALDNLFKALELSKKIEDDDYNKADILCNIGQVYLDLGKHNDAIEYLNKALEASKASSAKYYQVQVLDNLGHYYEIINQKDKSLKCYKDALKIAEAIDAKKNIANLNLKISNIYQEGQNYKMSLKHNEAYIKISEQLHLEEVGNQALFYEFQSQLKEKEREANTAKLEAKRLEQEARNSSILLTQLKLINTIGQEIMSSLNIEEIIQKTYNNLNKLLDATTFGIGIVNEKAGEVEFKGAMEKGKLLKDYSVSLDAGNRMAIHCINNKVDVVINDWYKEYNIYIPNEEVADNIAGEFTLSCIFLPLTFNNKVTGVITVQSFDKNAYSEQDVSLLKNIATFVSSALENAQLYENMESEVKLRTLEVFQQKEQLESTYNDLELIGKIGQKIISSRNFNKIFASLQREVNKLMDATVFSIRIYKPEENIVEYSFTMEKGETIPLRKISMDDDDNFTVWCIKNKKDIFINDNKKDYKKYTKKIIVVSGDMPDSLMFCPMIIGKKVIGVISVQSFKKNAYTRQHLNILKTLGSYAAIALENARTYESLEDTVKERTNELELSRNNLQIVGKIGQRIISSLNIEKIFSYIHTNVNKLMDANIFGIRIYHPEKNSVEYKYEIENNVLDPSVWVSMNNDDNYTVWCIKNKKSIFINDNNEEYKRYTNKIQVVKGEMPNSLILCPMILGRKVIGVITVQSYDFNAYNKFQLDMLTNIAAYAAISINNAKAYERIEEAKSALQDSNRNITLISKIGQQMTSTLNLERVLKIVYKNVNKLMDATAFLIGYYNEPEGLIEMKLGMENDKPIAKDIKFDVNSDTGYAVWCVKNRKEIFINDNEKEYANYLKERRIVDGKSTQSIIYLPLIVEKKVVGIITVQSFQKNAYTKYHLELLRSFAPYVAVAMNNAESFNKLEAAKSEIEKVNQSITTISQLGQKITSTFDLNNALEDIYQGINTLTDATTFGIWLYNDVENLLEGRYFVEMGEKLPVTNTSMDHKNSLAVWAVKNKKEAIVNDFENDLKKYINKAPKLIIGEMPQSMIFLPLMVEGRVIGVMTIQSFEKNTYSFHHLEMMRTLASYAAVALDNAQAYKGLEEAKSEIEKSRDNITLLGEIGQQITSTLELDKVLGLVYENVNKLMDAPVFIIGSFNSSKNVIEMKYGIENNVPIPYHEWTLDDEHRLAIWCVKNKETVFITDYQNEFNNYIPNIKIPKAAAGELPESVIYLPLLVDEKVVGIISIQSFTKDAYTKYQVELLKSFASYAAVALNNAESFNKLEVAKSEIEVANQSITTIAELGQKITSTFDLESALKDIYKGINTLTDATTFGIWFNNEKEEKLEGKLFIEHNKRLPSFDTPMNHKGSVAVWSIKNRKEVFINDWESDVPKITGNKPEIIVGESPLSAIFIPLIVEERIIGVMTIQSFEKHSYNQHHLEMMRTLASYAAIALDNAHAYQGLEEAKEEIEKSRDNISLISQIGQQITSTLDLGDVLKLVYENVNKLMDASAFLIGYFDRQNERIEVKLGMEKGKVIPKDIFYDLKDKNRFAVQCVVNKKEIIINDIQKEYKKYIKSLPPIAAGDYTHSLIYLPLIVEGKVIGIISVQSFEKNAYSKYHLELLKTFASFAGVALNNAESFNKLEEAKSEVEIANQSITTIAELGQKITSTFDLENALGDIYRGINTLTDATTFGIWFNNDEKQMLEGKLFVEKEKKLPVMNTPMNHKGSVAVWCIKNRKEVFITDFENQIASITGSKPKLIIGEYAKSAIYIPLLVDDRAIGVMTIQSFEKNAYTQHHLEMMRTLASYAAIALDNAQAYKGLEEAKLEIEKSYETVSILSEIGQKITSTLDINVILDIVYQNVNNLMDATEFGIGIYNEARKGIDLSLYIYRGEKLDSTGDIWVSLNDDNRLSVWCAKNKKDVYINDIEKEYSKYIQNLDSYNGDENLILKSVICIPLIIENNLIGLISVQSPEKNAYTPFHLSMLKTISSYAAVALNNAEAYEQINKAHQDIKNAQTKLVESEKMASLGQLTAGIAHEINNPINFISGNVKPLERDINDIFELVDKYDEIKSANGNLDEVLKNVEDFKDEIELDFLKDEISQLLAGIKDGANRTAEIVKGLRTFSRLDEADKKLASINESLDNTLVILRNRYKDRVEIIKEYGDFPNIECYPGKLNQVFVNIIGNAIQAIEGKGHIWLKTWQENSTIFISIKDDGAGIPEKIKEKIFEPFFTTKDVGEGTGLGLSISFGIIEKHGGTLEVKSKENQGTEFIIGLPNQN